MKKMRVFVLISLFALLLSGCITIRLETKIKEDGSGTKSFVMALDKSAMSMIEGMAEESGEQVDDIWAEARAGAERIPGAKVEDYSDDEREGIKVSVPFDNFDELEAMSNREIFEGADTVTVSEEGDTVTLKAVVSTGDIMSGLGEAGGEDLEGLDMGDIDIEYSYSVDVEGNILEHSPKDIATVDGGKVTWDLTQATAESVELMIKWEPGGGSSDMLLILLVLAAVGGVLLVAVGAFLALRGRSSSPPPAPADLG